MFAKKYYYYIEFYTYASTVINIYISNYIYLQIYNNLLKYISHFLYISSCIYTEQRCIKNY